MEQFIPTSIFDFVVLPLIIFVLRILDVSIGTLRIVFISKGNKFVAPILGFFEVFIWILAIGRIMQNLDNFVTYISYAAGFATGNLIGLWLEEKLAYGTVGLRVITAKDATSVIDYMKDHGYGVTSVEAMGTKGPVHVIYTYVKRTNLQSLLSTIKKFNPNAFYTIEDVRFVSRDTFQKKSIPLTRYRWFPFKRWRKGK